MFNAFKQKGKFIMRRMKKFLCGALVAATSLASVAITPLSTSATESYSIEYIRGDVNGDGNVSITDVMYVDKYLHGVVSADAETFTRLDATQDGVVDQSDYNLIRDYNLRIQTPANTSSVVCNNIDNSKKSYLKYTFAKQTAENNQKVDGYTLDKLPEIYSQPSSRLKKAPANNGIFKDRENVNVVKITSSKYNPNTNKVTIAHGTGFVIGNHVIATAAHCLCGIDDDTQNFEFYTSVKVDMYNESGVSDNNRIASYTSEAANGTTDKLTSYKSIKSLHVPRTYREHLLNKDGKESNVDYALIYVSEDLSDYTWDVGCISDEFKNSNTDLIATGITNISSTTPDRYYSKGKIIYDNDKYKLHTNALTYAMQSGGPIYYETNYVGETIKTVVGINTQAIVTLTKLNGEVIKSEVTGNGGIRMTPTLLQFYLNNPKLA